MVGGGRPAAAGGRLVYNSVLNLLGVGAPLAVAVFAIPILIQELGTARFGVLTLVWILIGYFGFFDFGIGRALTKLVAERLGSPEASEVPILAWMGLLLMLLLGCLGALVVALLSPWLVGGVLNIPPDLQREALYAMLVLGASLPLVTLTAGLRGLLEAYHRFDLVNAIRIPLGVFSFLGPLLVLPFSTSLAAIVAVLAAGRLVATGVHVLFVRRVVTGLGAGMNYNRRLVRQLLAFGGWMTVSNIVSPVLVYMDRFLIGALLSVTAVAYYATPYEVVTKLWIFPVALLGVLFPTFAAELRHAPERVAELFGHAVLCVLFVLAPVILVTVTFGGELLALWVGSEFAAHSTRVLQWLSVGVLINCLAQVAATVVHSAGRPDLTGKLHLCELPFYLIVLGWLTLSYGIEGAAIAWTLRVSVDGLILFGMAQRLLPTSVVWLRRAGASVLALLVCLLLGATTGDPTARAMLVLLTVLGGAPATWGLVLSHGERARIRAHARARLARWTLRPEKT